MVPERQIIGTLQELFAPETQVDEFLSGFLNALLLSEGGAPVGIDSSRHHGYRMWPIADDSMRNACPTPGNVRRSVSRLLQINVSKSV